MRDGRVEGRRRRSASEGRQLVCPARLTPRAPARRQQRTRYLPHASECTTRLATSTSQPSALTISLKGVAGAPGALSANSTSAAACIAVTARSYVLLPMVALTDALPMAGDQLSTRLLVLVS